MYKSVGFHFLPFHLFGFGTGKIASGAFTGLQALNKREVIPAQRIKGCFFMGVIISDLLINMSCYKLSPKTK